MYNIPSSVTAGLKASCGLFDLVPRATGERVSSVPDIEEAVTATGDPGHCIFFFCQVPLVVAGEVGL